MTVAPRRTRGQSPLPGRFQRAITSDFLQGEGPAGLDPWATMTRVDLGTDSPATHPSPKKDTLVVTDEGGAMVPEERQGGGDGDEGSTSTTTQTGSYKVSLNPDLPSLLALEI